MTVVSFKVKILGALLWFYTSFRFYTMLLSCIIGRFISFCCHYSSIFFFHHCGSVLLLLSSTLFPKSLGGVFLSSAVLSALFPVRSPQRARRSSPSLVPGLRPCARTFLSCISPWFSCTWLTEMLWFCIKLAIGEEKSLFLLSQRFLPAKKEVSCFLPWPLPCSVCPVSAAGAVSSLLGGTEVGYELGSCRLTDDL